jgi:hypothetical protein
VEWHVDGGEWIQRERHVDVYGRSAWNVVDHADNADTDGWRHSIYGDRGQCYGGDL